VDVTAETGRKNVLVLANETLLGPPLLDKIRERAAQGPSAFLIVAPQSDPTARSHPEAERRPRSALITLRTRGIDRERQLAPPHPYTAAMQATHDEKVDEIVISTFGAERSGWLRRDLVERLRKDTGLQVEHVVAQQPSEVAS